MRKSIQHEHVIASEKSFCRYRAVNRVFKFSPHSNMIKVKQCAFQLIIRHQNEKNSAEKI